MKLKQFDYDLPKNLIAQKPINPRDHSRLLILHKLTGKLEHKHFYNLIDYLKAGDVLVLNNTKVMAARLIGRRVGTGGKVEVFLLRKIDLKPLSRTKDLQYLEYTTSKGFLANARNDNQKKGEIWQCLVGGQKRKENLKVEFTNGLTAEILENNNDGTSTSLSTGTSTSLSTGTFNVKFNKTDSVLMRLIEKIGLVPLPPYISSASSEQVRKKQYQTIYADPKKIGSVAAPTAGLHFTPALLKKIKNKGVQIEEVTLQVGLGTFAPVKVDDITKHKMHSEYVEANAGTIERLYLAKHEGRRIIAVGTTSVRTIEAIVSEFPISNFQFPNNFQFSTTKFSKQFVNYNNWVNIFIYPGYKFKIVDSMITNFHLPKSTLLMLISAFAGKRNVDKAYREAINKEYRFFSYGDAMLIT